MNITVTAFGYRDKRCTVGWIDKDFSYHFWTNNPSVLCRRNTIDRRVKRLNGFAKRWKPTVDAALIHVRANDLIEKANAEYEHAEATKIAAAHMAALSNYRTALNAAGFRDMTDNQIESLMGIFRG